MKIDPKIFDEYLQKLFMTAFSGDAREESFYSALEGLLKRVAEKTERTSIHITTLPKQTEAGNPDFRIWDGNSRITGYIEAKKPTEERLDRIEDSEQLRRYRETFPNLILTNFLEFRLYRDGQRIETVTAARPLLINRLGLVPPIEKPNELWALLNHFLDFSIPNVLTAEALAKELAKRTRFLKEVIALELGKQGTSVQETLTGILEAFKKHLIADLTPEEFSDLYAQTVTYGLFAARVRSDNGFNRGLAFDRIPHTIGVLREIFRFISLSDLPATLAWIVDDISEVLAAADVAGILNRYYHEGKGSDPIVHFYETFLAEYDPEERERRGVYYTPEPVVAYIVRSLNQLLKTEFDKPDGLAAEGVTLLDPAAGTMTFVARAAQEAVEEFKNKYGTGAREDFIRKHILQNFYAFELMMAPYAVGHLKMSFFLEELGLRLNDDERVRFYLTNTLDMEELTSSRYPLLSSIAQESHLAHQVKTEKPILVILGNPPYSGHSSNRGNWIQSQIEHYKQVGNEKLAEKNPKWLQDDYVKFLRFAQWKIDQAGRGIVGMITNHSYLDNPTFRLMRKSLMNSFDDIYILDLHGNSLKRETCPDGSPDQNVFDIRQGVAIALFIKRGAKNKSEAAVHHHEIWGDREKKYQWLGRHEIKSTAWHELKPKSSFYLFIPRSEKREAKYNKFFSIPTLFLKGSVGIATARDNLTTHWSAEEAWKTVAVFSRMDPSLARRGYKLGKDVRDWKVTWAQKDLLDSGPSRKNIVPVSYRPFDTRYTYYTGKSRGFHCMPRREVMCHMLQDNLALCIGRAGHVVGADTWNLCFCSKFVTDLNLFYRGGNVILPLYLYPDSNFKTLFDHKEASLRKPNLNPKLVSALFSAYGRRKPTPEDIFYYIYAVLYARIYRENYSEFLRLDFPRVPFPADVKIFRSVAALGRRLAELHLLRSAELKHPIARFEGEGDGKVSKNRSCGFRYESEEQRIYINKTQYFSPVLEKVWNYRIGGYQVCEKWLKDRKERHLELDEIRTFCQIVTALKLTLDIQEEIDALYPEIEKDIITLPFD